MHLKPQHEPARRRRRPQPALVVALVALVAAMGGTATALPGRATVDRNDVKRGAIASKAIKDGRIKGVDLAASTVTGAKVADGGLTGADVADRSLAGGKLAAGAVGATELADGGVGAAELAPGAVTGAKVADGSLAGADVAPGAIGVREIADREPVHLVGTPGEPAFFDGGEGDCVWTNGIEGAQGIAPAGFAKDVLGRVWLQGALTVKDGPGGDGSCDFGDPGEEEDAIVFALPEGYRPAYFDLSGLPERILLAPGQGAKYNGFDLPPGAVYSVLGFNALFDGVSFVAAEDPAPATTEPAKLPGKALAALTR